MPFNRRRPRGRFPAFFAFGLVRVLLSGALVMWLWNWLLPAISSLRPITYLQAIALWVLSRILFGGFGHCTPRPPGSSGGWKRGAWRNKWMNMSQEEREKFQQQWRDWCKKKE